MPGRGAYERLWRFFAVSLLIVVGVQVAAGVLAEIRVGWWPAYDTNAYWLAAKHLLDGGPLYQESSITASGI